MRFHSLKYTIFWIIALECLYNNSTFCQLLLHRNVININLAQATYELFNNMYTYFSIFFKPSRRHNNGGVILLIMNYSKSGCIGHHNAKLHNMQTGKIDLLIVRFKTEFSSVS